MREPFYDQRGRYQAWRSECVESSEEGYVTHVDRNSILRMSRGLERLAVWLQIRHLEFRLCPLRNDHACASIQSYNYERSLCESDSWQVRADWLTLLSWSETSIEAMFAGSITGQSNMRKHSLDAGTAESYYGDFGSHLVAKRRQWEFASNYKMSAQLRTDFGCYASSVIRL